MKKNTFLFLFMIGLSQFVNSQCNKSVTGFGNNTSVVMYNVIGNVNVVLNSPTSVSVSLSTNFVTAAGPDVRIFLVDRGSLTNAQLKVTSNFLTRPRIEMGLSPVSGAANFTKNIPVGMNISDFETVYFYCQAFSQFWDYGSFTPFTSSDCSLLATNDFENNKLQLYPNPVSNELNLHLEETLTNYKVGIYNLLGSLVFESSNQSNSNNTINVCELNSGIYFVKIIDAENKVYQKRLIKK